MGARTSYLRGSWAVGGRRGRAGRARSAKQRVWRTDGVVGMERLPSRTSACSQAAPRRRVGGAERGTVRPAAGTPREPTRAGTGQPRRLGIILSFHRVYQPGPVRAAAPGPDPVARPVEGSRVTRGSRRAGVRGIRSVRGTKQRVRAAMRVRQCFPDVQRASCAGRVARDSDWRSLKRIPAVT